MQNLYTKPKRYCREKFTKSPKWKAEPLCSQVGDPCFAARSLLPRPSKFQQTFGFGRHLWDGYKGYPDNRRPRIARGSFEKEKPWKSHVNCTAVCNWDKDREVQRNRTRQSPRIQPHTYGRRRERNKFYQDKCTPTYKPKQTSTLTSHSVPKQGAGLNVRAKLTRI